MSGIDAYVRVLDRNGYQVTTRIADGNVTYALASSAYLMLALFEPRDNSAILEDLAAVQSALTHQMTMTRSELRWDLYVLVELQSAEEDPVFQERREQLESDTRYARKIVRANIAHQQVGATERALAPFLPLSMPEPFDDLDPLKAMAVELRGQGVDEASILRVMGGAF